VTDRSLFERALAALAANFNRELTPALMHTLWRALGDLSDVEVEQAAGLAIRYDRFFPTAARLRELARPEPDFAAQAEEAFAQVDALGVYHPLGYRWSEAAVEQALGAAACRAFRAIGGSDAWAANVHQYRRKDFVEVYVAAMREQQHEQRLAALPGARRRLTLGPLRALPAPQEG
jgi:hypothetical protein